MILSLYLENFRNFNQKEWHDFSDLTVIVGANGSGKTTLLEAISLFTPGRGLRHALLKDLSNKHIDTPMSDFLWLIRLHESDHHFGMGLTNQGRIIKKDKDNYSIEDIPSLFKVFWLTPEHDSLLKGEPAERRKFLDRLTYGLYPSHLRAIITYDRLRKERLALLKDQATSFLLDQVESQLADIGATINRSRLGLIHELKKHQSSTFIPYSFSIINEQFWDDDRGRLSQEWSRHRLQDQRLGKSFFGSHRCDWTLTYKKLPACFCSTGEQKSLVMSLMLSFVKIIQDFKILLLDDVMSHFDQNFVKDIVESLRSLDAIQTLMTTTSTVPNCHTLVI
jgi:DNA replication and repair protein RecF